jgi:hypothetical protein
MKPTSLLVLLLLLSSCPAFAESLTGNRALALAALVAENSPQLGAKDKRVMMHMLDGNLHFRFPPNKKISVLADRISCSAGDVDISEHSCELKFGSATHVLHGRTAHELFATLVEAGAGSEGAAGRVFEVISHLSCAIHPNEVKEKGGGGAECTFELT